MADSTTEWVETADVEKAPASDRVLMIADGGYVPPAVRAWERWGTQPRLEVTTPAMKPPIAAATATITTIRIGFFFTVPVTLSLRSSA